MPQIKALTCHKIINSRGDWTIETKATLDDGSEGVQTIPDGASKGENEAVYIDVNRAIQLIPTAIFDALKDVDPFDQQLIDKTMIEMDGTPNKNRLGGNSILSVSLAVAKACAVSRKLELYQYLASLFDGKNLSKQALKFPTPLFNILNGGKHANNGLSFQEFMVIPAMSMPFDKAMELGVTVYHELKKALLAQNLEIGVGDEGGFAPKGLTADKALTLIKAAASQNYKVGDEVFFGMDAASGSFHDQDNYFIEEENLHLNGAELADYYATLLKKFELIYLEDGFYEKDYAGWFAFYQKFAERLMLVGDDLVTTNPKYLKIAIDKQLINAVIVKPNQVGTLTETFEFIRDARKAGMKIVVSHRSGDTAEDTFIADLALAVGGDFIKSGSPVRGERVAKYNRLLDVFNS